MVQGDCDIVFHEIFYEDELQDCGLGHTRLVKLWMNPSLQTKNILLRGAVLNTISKCKQVLEMLPEAVIHFTWSEGKSNPADLSTKLLLDPISQINSELFRTGPDIYKSKTEVLKNTYLKMSKRKGIEWFGLDDAVTKTKKNVAMLRELFRIRIGNFNNMKSKENNNHFGLRRSKNKMNIKCSKKIALLILLFSLAIVHTQKCRSPAQLEFYTPKTTSYIKINIKEASQENISNYSWSQA